MSKVIRSHIKTESLCLLFYQMCHGFLQWEGVPIKGKYNLHEIQTDMVTIIISTVVLYIRGGFFWPKYYPTLLKTKHHTAVTLGIMLTTVSIVRHEQMV